MRAPAGHRRIAPLWEARRSILLDEAEVNKISGMEHDKRLGEAVIWVEEGSPGVTYRRGRCAGAVDITDVLHRWSVTGRLLPNISVHEAS